ncbi:MAG: alcohol dehydrogenase catalytic domain-containing protein [Dehalococcoidia bacterium]|jgi:L-iditol 2-dehydrogenase|nr:MAG: L-iditol 2-dehydrogenase [Chloroflexota bacterium]|tara:strand:+ start:618 stop:1643 length:1026 start_codon:yes stop_codon:yes gene_type:complete
MKAATFLAPGKISVSSRDIPICKPGDILVKLSFASLCASDIRVYRGEKYAKKGIIPGHEFSGIIVDSKSSNKKFKIGERITVCPIISCGICNFCINGMRNRCLDRKTMGYDSDGGFSEFVLIPKKIIELGHLFIVPKNVDLKIAALVEPISCVMNSIQSINLNQNDSLAIIGGGPMGLLHLILASYLGVKDINIFEPKKERRVMAESLGANAYNPSNNWEQRALNKNKSGFDKIILSVGIGNLINPALKIVKKKGVINLFAGFPANKLSKIDVNLIHYNEIVVTGTQNATLKNYQDTLKIINKLDNVGKLITNEYKLNEVPRAYTDRNKLKGVKSIIDFSV